MYRSTGEGEFGASVQIIKLKMFPTLRRRGVGKPGIAVLGWPWYRRLHTGGNVFWVDLLSGPSRFPTPCHQPTPVAVFVLMLHGRTWEVHRLQGLPVRT